MAARSIAAATRVSGGRSIATTGNARPWAGATRPRTRTVAVTQANRVCTAATRDPHHARPPRTSTVTRRIPRSTTRGSRSYSSRYSDREFGSRRGRNSSPCYFRRDSRRTATTACNSARGSACLYGFGAAKRSSGRSFSCQSRKRLHQPNCLTFRLSSNHDPRASGSRSSGLY